MSEQFLPTARERRAAEAAAMGEAYEEEVAIALEEYKGPIREYIVLNAPRNEIKKRFQSFLTTFLDHNQRSVYSAKIRRMCEGTLVFQDARDFCQSREKVSKFLLWILVTATRFLQFGLPMPRLKCYRYVLRDGICLWRVS